MWLFPSFCLPYFPQHRFFRLSVPCRAGSTSLGLFPWGVPCSHEEISAGDRHLEDLPHTFTGIKLVEAEHNAVSFDSMKYLNEERPVADWIQRSKALKWSLHCSHRQVRGKVPPGGPLAHPKRGPRAAPCICTPLSLAPDAPSLSVLLEVFTYLWCSAAPALSYAQSFLTVLVSGMDALLTASHLASCTEST